MTEFPKVQARFDAAMAIIEGASTGGADPEETKKLSAELSEVQKSADAAGKAKKAAEADAKVAKEELAAAKIKAEAASKALKDAETKVAALEKDVAAKEEGSEAQRAAMIKQIDALDKARANSDKNLSKARQYNKHLKKLNASLRKANEANVAKPDLINKSLETELEQIKEQRDVDLEQVNGVLARLTPLVEGA